MRINAIEVVHSFPAFDGDLVKLTLSYDPKDKVEPVLNVATYSRDGTMTGRICLGQNRYLISQLANEMNEIKKLVQALSPARRGDVPSKRGKPE